MDYESVVSFLSKSLWRLCQIRDGYFQVCSGIAGTQQLITYLIILYVALQQN